MQNRYIHIGPNRDYVGSNIKGSKIVQGETFAMIELTFPIIFFNGVFTQHRPFNKRRKHHNVIQGQNLKQSIEMDITHNL